MIRRICPVCDRVMSLPHYCLTCRQFVRKPWIRDVNYYLNESHPREDHGCSYHVGEAQTYASGNTAGAGKPYVRQNSAPEWRMNSGAGTQWRDGRGKPANKVEKGKLIAVIIFIYIFFRILTAALSLL